ncbi:MAG: hypothetical protein Q7U40_10610, partial [Desulfatirhabdiaceae bacterium]|nr:hypothetical protein [Desulfatirhabdiaceae bacterium]
MRLFLLPALPNSDLSRLTLPGAYVKTISLKRSHPVDPIIVTHNLPRTGVTIMESIWRKTKAVIK